MERLAGPTRQDCLERTAVGHHKLPAGPSFRFKDGHAAFMDSGVMPPSANTSPRASMIAPNSVVSQASQRAVPASIGPTPAIWQTACCCDAGVVAGPAGTFGRSARLSVETCTTTRLFGALAD